MRWSLRKCCVIGGQVEEVFRIRGEEVRKQREAVYVVMTEYEDGLNANLSTSRVKNANKRLTHLGRSFRRSGLLIRSKTNLVTALVRAMYEYSIHLVKITPERLQKMGKRMDSAARSCTGAPEAKLFKRARVELASQSAPVRKWKAAN